MHRDSIIILRIFLRIYANGHDFITLYIQGHSTLNLQYTVMTEFMWNSIQSTASLKHHQQARSVFKDNSQNGSSHHLKILSSIFNQFIQFCLLVKQGRQNFIHVLIKYIKRWSIFPLLKYDLAFFIWWTTQTICLILILVWFLIKGNGLP